VAASDLLSQFFSVEKQRRFVSGPDVHQEDNSIIIYNQDTAKLACMSFNYMIYEDRHPIQPLE